MSASRASSSQPAPAATAGLESVPLYRKVVYSGLSGAIATTCIYPMDICKTKLQNQHTTGAAREFSGPLDTFLKLFRREGVRGLYRGWPPNVILVMPEKALKLTMNDVFQGRIKRHYNASELTLGMQMCAGGMAGFTQVIATNPMELLKIQGATMAEKIKSGALKEAIPYGTLVRQLGVTGLYTGVLSTLARDVPFSMIYFSCYAQCKKLLIGNEDPAKVGGLKPFLAGAIAGTLAAGVTCPIDVIKTRVHAAARPERIAWSTFAGRERQMLVSTFHSVVQKEGAASLFKGLLPRCAIISPLFAITMFCYEKMQLTLG